MYFSIGGIVFIVVDLEEFVEKYLIWGVILVFKNFLVRKFRFLRIFWKYVMGKIGLG